MRDRAGGKRLHFALGADAVFFLVPAWEGREEEEADEGEDDCDDAADVLAVDQESRETDRNVHQVREHHHILKLAR